MEKIIKENKDGKIQITVVDERWYIDTKSDEPKFVPSSTWIAGYYPKGIAYMKWLASKGWDEAEEIKSAAGDKGSRVHRAIDLLLEGEVIPMQAKLADQNGDERELTFEEWDAIVSFQKFYEDYTPETVVHDLIVWNEKDGYAGTLDFVAKIKEAYWLIDFKTSANIYPSHEIQLASYAHAYPGVELLERHGKRMIKVMHPVDKLGILQVGYARNKDRYKLTEIPDKYHLFLAAKEIWQAENGDTQPKKLEYPEYATLNLKPHAKKDTTGTSSGPDS
jgi:hypothetical protein